MMGNCVRSLLAVASFTEFAVEICDASPASIVCVTIRILMHTQTEKQTEYSRYTLQRGRTMPFSPVSGPVVIRSLSSFGVLDLDNGVALSL